jgi:hypothetical protein
MDKNLAHANHAFSTTWINFCDHNDTGKWLSFQCVPWGNFYRPLVKVNKQMSSNSEYVSVMTLTVFYRIVICCEKLILQCCDLNWQTGAIWVMDCKSTFLLRILIRVALVRRHYRKCYMAFTERIDKISRKLSDYAEMDRSQLKGILLEVFTVVDSRYFNGDLVT